MKPSERRALREQKRAQQEAEAQGESEIGGSVYTESAAQVSDEHHRYKARKERKERAVKKEGFFSKHAMLITAVIGSLVIVLGVVLGIDFLVNYVNENQHEVYDDGVDIDIASVGVLHDNYYNVKWKHLDGFNYTDYSYSKTGGRYILREYPIDGTEDIVLKVGGPESQAEPDFIYVIDYASGKSERIDISVDDPYYFFDERGLTAKEDN